MSEANRFFKNSAVNCSADKNNYQSGFSLIEMIVVVAIMAVLVVVIAPSLLTYNERSRAEKDTASMDELVNAVQLALADSEVYDEVLRFSTVDNVSCYVDTNSESNYAKIVTKRNPDGVDQYTFTSDARRLDETPYFAAGNMRGVTLTFAPDKGSNGSTFDLKQGVVNQYVQVSNNQRIGAMPKLYNRIRSTVGDTIKSDSQTYRNSEYTIFIRLGTTGGNDAGQQDSITTYGQWSGTNLPTQVSYQIVTDRIVGDTGNQIVEINDNKWNETNGNKLTLKPGDLNGGGSFDSTTNTGNSKYENNESDPEEDNENGGAEDSEWVVALENNKLLVDQVYSIYVGNQNQTAELPQGDNGLILKSNGEVEHYFNGNLIQTVPYEIDDGKIFIPALGTHLEGVDGKSYIKATAMKRILVKGNGVVNVGDYTYTLASFVDYKVYWTVHANDKNKTAYGEILSELQDVEVQEMTETFANCTKMTASPAIPSTIKLLNRTYSGCTGLITAPTIPEGVQSMSSTFSNCSKLTGDIVINCNSMSLSQTFYNTVKPIHLIGTCSESTMAQLAATANNGNVTYGEQQEVKILSFKIQKISEHTYGVKETNTYYFEEGMSLKEWIMSDYNTSDIAFVDENFSPISETSTWLNIGAGTNNTFDPDLETSKLIENQIYVIDWSAFYG